MKGTTKGRGRMTPARAARMLTATNARPIAAAIGRRFRGRMRGAQQVKRTDPDVSALQHEQEQMREILQGAAVRVQEEQERTEAILFALGQGLFGLDACGCIQFLNPACERMVGWSEEQIQGAIFHDVVHPPRSRRTPCSPETCQLLNVIANAVAMRVEHDSFQRSDGSALPVSYFCTPVFRSGVAIGSLVCFDDISERLAAAEALDEYSRHVKAQNEQLYLYCEELTATQRRLEQQAEELTEKNAQILEANLCLQALATTDGMTGLANHRAFQEALRTVWTAGRNQGRVQVLTLMLVDVDFFKAYNDSFGHPAGDEVLKTVARLLRENMRDTDLIARYGGEEFVVVAWDAGSADAMRFANRLCATIESYPFLNRRVTISIGLATQDARQSGAGVGPNLYETPDELIKAADQALYEAKRGGRNRACAAQTETR